MRHFSAFLITILSLPVMAGHYSGGNITYTCDGTGLYTVTLQLYVDCSGFEIVPQTISFASGCDTTFEIVGVPPSEGIEVSQLCEAELVNSTCNGGWLPGMRLYEFVTVQDLSYCDDWTISWNLCCRSNSINLVGNPGSYFETSLHTVNGSCGNSPVFAQDMIPYVCVNQPVTHNFGVSDIDGDSLVSVLLAARTWAGFEQPVVYEPGFSGAAPIQGISLDATSGQMTFTPTLSGNYIVAMEVSAYNAAGELTGTVVLDILFVVLACSNTNPDADSGTILNLDGNATLVGEYALSACISPSFCFDATITDPDDLQSLTLTSNIDQVLSGATFEASGPNPATASVCWDGAGASPGTYVFTITAMDDACPQTASRIFSYSITINGPYAGQNSTATLCSDAPPQNLFELLSGDPDPGGVFTVVAPGVYHYVLPGNGDCAADSSVLIVETAQAPNAGVDGDLLVCDQGASVQLLAQLGGTPQPDGTWFFNDQPANGIYDPALDAPGSYAYVLPGVAPCVSDTAVVVVTESSSPNAGIDAQITVCSDLPSIDLLPYLSGAELGGTWFAPGGIPFSGTFIPAADSTGVYTYVLSPVLPCTGDQATVTVTVVEASDAGIDNQIALCTSGGPIIMIDSLLGTPFPGGAWTDPFGNVHPPSFDPLSDPPGIYCYVIDGTAPCPSTVACLTITVLGPEDPVCLSTAIDGPAGRSGLVIEPDPNNGHFRVRINGMIYRLDVLDLSGRVVLNVRMNTSSSSPEIDLPSELKAGRYVLRAFGADGTRQLPFTLVR